MFNGVFDILFQFYYFKTHACYEHFKFAQISNKILVVFRLKNIIVTFEFHKHRCECVVLNTHTSQTGHEMSDVLAVIL